VAVRVGDPFTVMEGTFNRPARRRRLRLSNEHAGELRRLLALLQDDAGSPRFLRRAAEALETAIFRPSPPRAEPEQLTLPGAGPVVDRTAPAVRGGL